MEAIDGISETVMMKVSDPHEVLITQVTYWSIDFDNFLKKRWSMYTEYKK